MQYDSTLHHSFMKCIWNRYLALFRYCSDAWIEYAEYESEWNWEDSKIQEVKPKDKWIKIRIRYSGKKLAVITAVRTLYSISYS